MSVQRTIQGPEAARVGVEPPQELEAMAPAEVDAWLARALMGGAPAL